VVVSIPFRVDSSRDCEAGADSHPRCGFSVSDCAPSPPRTCSMSTTLALSMSALSMATTTIRVGELVDAKDTNGIWYAAVVKGVGETGVAVHYKGWGKTFDEVIPPTMVTTNIAPLFAHSPNRSKWEVGDAVEILASSPLDKPVWLAATIRCVDGANARVQVEFSALERDTALRKFGRARYDMEGTEKGRSIFPYPYAARVGAVIWFGREVLVRWYNILDDEICPFYTHIKGSTPSAVKP
jgi:hypothetical protein